MKHELDSLYHLLDVSSVGVIVGVLMGWMPNLATVFTVAWLGMRLYNEIMLAVDRGRARCTKRKGLK